MTVECPGCGKLAILVPIPKRGYHMAHAAVCPAIGRRFVGVRCGTKQVVAYRVAT